LAANVLYAVILVVVLLISLLEGPESLLESGSYRNSTRVFYYRYLYRLRVFLQDRVSRILDLYIFIWLGVAVLTVILASLFNRLRLPTGCFAVAVILFTARVFSPSGASLTALAVSVAGAALAKGDQYLAITSSLAFLSEFLVAELPRTASRDILYVCGGLFVGYWGAVRFMQHRALSKGTRTLKYSVHILVMSLLMFGLAIPIVILDLFCPASRKARIAVFVLRIIFEPFRVTTYLLILIALSVAYRRAPASFSTRGGYATSNGGWQASDALSRELDRELACSAAACDSME